MKKTVFSVTIFVLLSVSSPLFAKDVGETTGFVSCEAQAIGLSQCRSIKWKVPPALNQSMTQEQMDKMIQSRPAPSTPSTGKATGRINLEELKNTTPNFKFTGKPSPQPQVQTAPQPEAPTTKSGGFFSSVKSWFVSAYHNTKDFVVSAGRSLVSFGKAIVRGTVSVVKAIGRAAVAVGKAIWNTTVKIYNATKKTGIAAWNWTVHAVKTVARVTVNIVKAIVVGTINIVKKAANAVAAFIKNHPIIIVGAFVVVLAAAAFVAFSNPGLIPAIWMSLSPLFPIFFTSRKLPGSTTPSDNLSTFDGMKYQLGNNYEGARAEIQGVINAANDKLPTIKDISKRRALQNQIKNLQNFLDDYPRTLLAQDSYNKHTDPINPELTQFKWEKYSVEDAERLFNLPKGLLGDDGEYHVTGNGFHADIYHNTETGEVCISFRGTNPLSLSDWIEANFAHGINGAITEQYTQAQTLARLVKTVNDIKGIATSFTGHSLGGGLSEYASLSTGGSTAYVFNPANLTTVDLPQFNMTPQDLEQAQYIHHYFTDGEVLHAVQAPAFENTLRPVLGHGSNIIMDSVTGNATAPLDILNMNPLHIPGDTTLNTHLVTANKAGMIKLTPTDLNGNPMVFGDSLSIPDEFNDSLLMRHPMDPVKGSYIKTMTDNLNSVQAYLK